MAESKIEQILNEASLKDRRTWITWLTDPKNTHASLAITFGVSETSVRRWRNSHMVEGREPRILVWDIESSPILGYTWGLWEQNVIRIKEDWKLLTVSWTWLGSGKYHAKQLCDFDDYKKGEMNDKSLTEFARDLLDEADYSIAHNGNAFDVKKINGKILEHGFAPPSPHTQLDTLRIAKRHMKISANSLDHLGELLGVGRKLKHPGFDMWLGCMAGSKADWEKMRAYAIQDIVLLEDVFNCLRPWVTGLNYSLFLGNGTCPNCGSKDLHEGGLFKTQTTSRTAFQCGSCGSWSKQKKGGKYV